MRTNKYLENCSPYNVTITVDQISLISGLVDNKSREDASIAVNRCVDNIIEIHVVIKLRLSIGGYTVRCGIYTVGWFIFYAAVM